MQVAKNKCFLKNVSEEGIPFGFCVICYLSCTYFQADDEPLIQNISRIVGRLRKTADEIVQE